MSPAGPLCERSHPEPEHDAEGRAIADLAIRSLLRVRVAFDPDVAAVARAVDFHGFAPFTKSGWAIVSPLLPTPRLRERLHGFLAIHRIAVRRRVVPVSAVAKYPQPWPPCRCYSGFHDAPYDLVSAQHVVIVVLQFTGRGDASGALEDQFLLVHGVGPDLGLLQVGV